nr:protein-disulfide reductase DsbD domain-containing protein [Solimonas marina]
MIRLTGAALLVVSTAAAANTHLFDGPASANDLLTAAQAFSMLPVERHGQSLHLSWSIAPGYYLYRQRIKVETLAPSAAGVEAIRLPDGIAHHDDHFGDVEIYRNDLEADVPLSATPSAPLRVRVTYQGCADAGVCYPPQTVVQTIAP